MNIVILLMTFVIFSLFLIITVIQPASGIQDNGNVTSEKIKNFEKNCITEKGEVKKECLPTDNTAVFAAIVTGIATFTGTYLTTTQQVKKQLKSQYSVSLRDKRIDVYKDLWAYLKPLAFHSLDDQIPYSQIEQLSKDLIRWYYGLGGLLLTESSQRLYTEFQTKIKMELNKKKFNSTYLPLGTTDRIKEMASSLRTSLIRDVGTREELGFDYE